MTALYICDIDIVLNGRPKMRKNQRKPPKVERIRLRRSNIPAVLNDQMEIHPKRFNATMLRLTKDAVKNIENYRIEYSLSNIRFSSKIMVDLDS